MLRRAVCALAVVAFSFGLVVAADFRGVITKVSEDGKTITVGTKFDRETKKLAEEKNYTLSATAKVVKGKFNKEEKKLEAGAEFKESLSDILKKSKRGLFAMITTNDEGQVTQIIVAQPKGKFKGKGKKKPE